MVSLDSIDEDSTKSESTLLRQAIDDEASQGIELGEKRPLLTKDKIQENDGDGCYIPKRFEVLFLAYIGTSIMFVMRINVSVTMAVMTNASYTTEAEDQNETVETCRVHNSSHEHGHYQDGGEFLWSSHEQELILAGFFYGYSVGQIPAGWLSDKIGGTRVFVISMFLSATVSLLSPIAAELGPSYFFAVRILCGIGESATFPALGSIVARWFPPQDYSTTFSILLSSSKFGTFIGTILSGFISSVNLLGGWPLTYYCFGGFTIVLVLVWMLLVYETPSRHPRISVKEKKYLSTTVVKEKNNITIPVLSIVTSLPVWAMVFTSFGSSWSNQMVFTNQPIYLKHVQGMDIEQIAIVAAIPYLVEAIFLVIGGMISSKLLNSQTLGVGATRKLMTFIGLTVSALFYLLLAFVGCNIVLSIVFMIGAVGFNGLNTSGYLVNLMDIAPRLAGSILGFINCTAGFSGILGPYVVGILTPNQADVAGWQTVFFIACGVNLCSCLVFVMFGSGKEQEWAKERDEDKS